MQFGRYFEEFEVGRGLPALAGQDGDGERRPSVLPDHDEPPPAASGRSLRARPLPSSGATSWSATSIYSLLLGMSVPDVSGRAIANLEVESLRHVAPTFHGDTIYGETTVLDKKESGSKPDRGVVTVRDPRLQAGRHAGLCVPPPGDGAEEGVRRARVPELPGRRYHDVGGSTCRSRRRLPDSPGLPMLEEYAWASSDGCSAGRAPRWDEAWQMFPGVLGDDPAQWTVDLGAVEAAPVTDCRCDWTWSPVSGRPRVPLDAAVVAQLEDAVRAAAEELEAGTWVGWSAADGPG